MIRTVTTSYLEMHSPAELRPARTPELDLQVQQATIASPEFARFLYASVGGDWYWLDRLDWSYGQWAAHLQRPECETWVGWVGGTPAGYCELERRADRAVELVYFGLLPQFIGRGIGGALLSAVVERAWQPDTARVWLHTCTLDGPVALRNYQARGFQLYDQQHEDVELPDLPPGPWPASGVRG